MRRRLVTAIALAALAMPASAWSQTPPPGLMAAYSFDEGSGTLLHDTSGNGHTGAIANATWTAGRHGSALSFNGTDAHVDLGALGTFYQQGFTLEAWVQKATSTRKDVGIVGSWAGSGPMLWVDHLAGNYQLTLGSSLSSYLDSGESPLEGVWQHLAATFDGTAARFYIDGVEVASRLVSSGIGSSNAWRVGAYGGVAGNFFDGLIDDVRIYSRALTAAEVVTDSGEPVPPPDTTPPSAPGQLSASGSVAEATLSWQPATDNVGVATYDVHRATVPGFTPSSSNRIAQATGTSYTDAGLAGGTYYYKVRAEDAAGNIGPPSNEASATVTTDTTPPTVSITSPVAGTTVGGAISVSASASDDRAVAGVQFRLDGVNLAVEDVADPYGVIWDTRGEVNGAHTLTAVARDSSGNVSVSSAVVVTVSNDGVSPAGLRAAYGLDQGSGTMALDSSGNNATGALVGAGWTTSGRFGGALSLNGTNGRVDLPSLGTFYKTGFTLEGWVLKQSSKLDVGVLGTWAPGQGGPMIWVDHSSGRYRLTLTANAENYLDSGRAPAVGQWQHVAVTYDGAVVRFYVDGEQSASAAFAGNVGDSNVWRIGAYGATPGGFFDGLVDNVRIYDRALTATEIGLDMVSRIQPDRAPPQVTSVTPGENATGVGVGTAVTARFNEPMQAASINSTTFRLRDQAGGIVPATVSYDQSTWVAKLKPQSALQFSAQYRATLAAGGPKDLAGNALAAERSWSFTTEQQPLVLVLTAASNPFSSYLGEILRNEGLPEFTAVDVSSFSANLLSGFDVVLIGNISLSMNQVTTLTDWVSAGGNLIAMRPDKKLAALLGLNTASGSLSNAYLQVNTATTAGAGIVGQTIQYHGTADRYTLNGATSIATLYSNATTPTSNPAVTLRSVGANGGEAAAFTYDLARSVVYTRQGNPAWAGQERDGAVGLRPNDMFYSTWINTNKIAIPQADEQQRLLANLITTMERDRVPVPRFWYLPRGEKAVVVLSGDDHSTLQAPGGIASNFDRLKELSSPGCVVSRWECVRASAYTYTTSTLTNAQAAGYVAEGFEVGLHPNFGSCPAGATSESALAAAYDAQLAQFGAKYTSIPPQVSSRSHCVFWPDWASNAKVEGARGIRMDANYYHYPASWLGTKPGFLNGGGFPMRFADTDGSLIDVYQQNTNVNDEITSAFATTIDALLDKALGPEGYYGAFGTNIHMDDPAPTPGYEQIVPEAQARGVPLISYKQLLDWVDGRNASTIGALGWAPGVLTFATTVGAGADGLQAMLPTQGPSGTLSAVTCAGSPVDFTVQTVKGLEYAMFDAVTGVCTANYS
jgi:Concanavalin A-like lectin/glucanases superfamily/Bacterial Ig-like domain/Bacterial Ig domain